MKSVTEYIQTLIYKYISKSTNIFIYPTIKNVRKIKKNTKKLNPNKKITKINFLKKKHNDTYQSYPSLYTNFYTPNGPFFICVKEPKFLHNTVCQVAHNH